MGHSPVFAPFHNVNTRGAAFGTTAGHQYVERYVEWTAAHAEAPTAGSYQFGRNDTDQLLANVPTGFSHRWTIENVLTMDLSSTFLDLNVPIDHDVTFPDTLSGSAKGFDAVYTVSNSANSVSSIRAFDFQINQADGFNLTTEIGVNAVVSRSGATGILGNAFGLNLNIANTGAGTITNGTALSLISANVGGGTFTNYIGIDFSLAGATNNSAMDFKATFVSNSRAAKVSEGGVLNARFFPLSRADTGITFDSTDLVFATTTSGDIHLSPFGDVQMLSGVFQGFKGGDLASANDMAVPAGNYQDVTGTTQINTMAVTNIQAGTAITLQFDSTPTVKHATAGAGAQFQLAGAVDFVATAGDTLTVTYDGTFWREIGRAVI